MTYYRVVTQGTDPEVAIFDKDNNIVPAGTVFRKAIDVIRERNLERETNRPVPFRMESVNLGGKSYVIKETELIVGNRNIPLPIFKATGYPSGSVQIDGIAVEFTTNPASCRNHIIQDIAGKFRAVKEIVKLANKNWRVGILPAVSLTPEQLQALPKEAQIFGCSPDLDIYGEAEKCLAVVDASTNPIRSFGGHMHASFAGGGLELLGDDYGKKSMVDWFSENSTKITITLDRIIGITSVAMTGGELETRRRSIYGQAGRVRVQDYGGIEYRTPSNFWLMHPVVANYMMLLMQVALNVSVLEDLRNQIWELAKITEIVDVINNSRTDRAMELVEATMELIMRTPELSRSLNDSAMRTYRMAGKRVPTYYNQQDEMIEIPRYFYERGGVANIVDPFEAINNWTQVKDPEYGELGNTFDFRKEFEN